VLWAAPAYGFVVLSDAYTTGSSIMPQKRNPDAAELVRAKSGRILGAFVGLTAVVKGLALAYAKDLQEDKEPVFSAADALNLSLRAMAGIVGDLKANNRARQAFPEGAAGDRTGAHSSSVQGALARGFGECAQQLWRHRARARRRTDRLLEGAADMTRPLIVAIALALLVSACGLKNDLRPPPGSPASADERDPSRPPDPLGQ
jgi:hypothetical protein